MKKLMFVLMIVGLLVSCDKIEEDNNIDQLVEELESAQLKSTQDDSEDHPCAELVYPVDFKMSDGTMITVNSKEEKKTAFADWYKNNPDNKERPSLVYPVKVIFKGHTYRISNEQEMKRVRQACGEEKYGEDETSKRRIMKYLLEKGFDRDKIKLTMDGLYKAVGDAKGQGREYKMSRKLYRYFSETVGLTNEQIRIVRTLAIRLANAKKG